MDTQQFARERKIKTPAIQLAVFPLKCSTLHAIISDMEVALRFAMQLGENLDGTSKRIRGLHEESLDLLAACVREDESRHSGKDRESSDGSSS